ncbi:hypothetical protein [Flavobacterium sandaracinum]|uniref:Uncharacterized protein n=1 Tax=Flavobacterium sandaracinum TaxID=2541733 RepID=A0A4R5CYG4_9FLAO|nr:hypothetical protein [Flavobacterium sandaracinum]TDE05909.1 hypothetical protein E0F91_04820 [Flavobacterium sandaracinum]
MKKVNLLFVTLAAVFINSVNAQDNNDLNFASHTLNVNVPEVALLDIYDSNTGSEAGVIVFNMANATQVGTNAEAGLYGFAALSYTNLYLNYTSVVATAANADGYDLTRQINVQLEAGSTFPASLDLRIMPVAPSVIANGGTTDSAGTVTAAGVALGATNAIGVDALLVTSIESVYTGDLARGVRLTYTLEQNGNFSLYRAGDYQATVKYTLTNI